MGNDCLDYFIFTILFVNPRSIIHHPSSTIHHPSSIIHHPSGSQEENINYKVSIAQSVQYLGQDLTTRRSPLPRRAGDSRGSSLTGGPDADCKESIAAYATRLNVSCCCCFWSEGGGGDFFFDGWWMMDDG